MKVLVVDDAKFIRVSLKMMLEHNGYQVVGEAINGRQAVEMFTKLQPDLVTMDITMPEMTGIQALRLIKEQEPEAKVVMISAMGQEKFVKEAILAGANGFILKPFKEEKVIQGLSKVCPV